MTDKREVCWPLPDPGAGLLKYCGAAWRAFSRMHKLSAELEEG
jgi:hypothetical protein